MKKETLGWLSSLPRTPRHLTGHPSSCSGKRDVDVGRLVVGIRSTRDSSLSLLRLSEEVEGVVYVVGEEVDKTLESFTGKDTPGTDLGTDFFPRHENGDRVLPRVFPGVYEFRPNPRRPRSVCGPWFPVGRPHLLPSRVRELSTGRSSPDVRERWELTRRVGPVIRQQTKVSSRMTLTLISNTLVYLGTKEL